jgi:hypothetical protein
MVGGYGVLLWPAALSTGWLLWPPQLYAIWRSPAYPPNGGSLLAERPIFARALVLSRGDFDREIRRRLLIAPVCCRRLCFGRFGHLLAPSVTALPRIVPAGYASRNMGERLEKVRSGPVHDAIHNESRFATTPARGLPLGEPPHGSG